ncbi:hypothetical protein OAG29_02215, partial [Planctomycetaceae bacterium]|nr:hypothetical protein [Planctomycetaceae bacterium]
RPFEYRESRKKKMLCDLTESDLYYCLSDERVGKTKDFFNRCGFREVVNLDWELRKKSVIMIYIPKKVDIMIEQWIEDLEFAD